MVQNKFYIYHFLLFFGLTLLMNPPKENPPKLQAKKIETEQKQSLAIVNASDMLHDEMLFKY